MTHSMTHSLPSAAPNLAADRVIPFHAARAYATPASPARVDHLDAPRPPQKLSAPRTASLVAARVPGGIDFDAQMPTRSMQMYTRPADKNAAATAVDAGRVLDLSV
jgi:hypothetical protein